MFLETWLEIDFALTTHHLLYLILLRLTIPEPPAPLDVLRSDPSPPPPPPPVLAFLPPPPLPAPPPPGPPAPPVCYLVHLDHLLTTTATSQYCTLGSLENLDLHLIQLHLHQQLHYFKEGRFLLTTSSSSSTTATTLSPPKSGDAFPIPLP